MLGLRLGSGLELGLRCIYRVEALGECVDGSLQPCAPHLRCLRFGEVSLYTYIEMSLRRGRPVHVQEIGA